MKICASVCVCVHFNAFTLAASKTFIFLKSFVPEPTMTPLGYKLVWVHVRVLKFAHVRVLALSDTCMMHQAIEEHVLSCEHCYERFQVRSALRVPHVCVQAPHACREL